jgi:hypothetical protein
LGLFDNVEGFTNKIREDAWYQGQIAAMASVMIGPHDTEGKTTDVGKENGATTDIQQATYKV